MYDGISIPGVELAEEIHLQREVARSPFVRFINKLSDISSGVSTYLVYPAILLVIIVDVIGRNFFLTPLSWATEGSSLFLIAAIFLAVGRVELEHDHIILDILYAHYSPQTKMKCDIFTRSLAALWMTGATIRSAIEIPTSIVLRESGQDFRYPYWPLRVLMTIGFLVLTLCLIANIVIAVKDLREEKKNG
ncbi:MAG: TRAP transporter small permease [Desulfovibrionaceae bacterium]